MLVPRLVTAAAVALCPAPVLPRAAEQPWQVSSYQERVFSAFLRNDAFARLVVECRVPRFSNPEVTVTLTFRAESRLRPRSDFTATITAGDRRFRLPLTRVGEPDEEAGYRWTAMGRTAFAQANDLAEAIGEGRSMAVADGSGGPPEEFSYDAITASGLRDVVRRCSPASVHARREVENATNVPALLALEASANDKCRGGSGDLEATWAACDERTE